MAPLALGVMRVISIVVIALASTAGVAALVWRAAVPSEVEARTNVEILVLGEHVARGVAAASTDGDAARRAAALAELAASLQVDLSVHDASGAPVAAAGAPVPPLATPELAAVLTGQVRRVGEPWPPRGRIASCTKRIASFQAEPGSHTWWASSLNTMTRGCAVIRSRSALPVSSALPLDTAGPIQAYVSGSRPFPRRSGSYKRWILVR